MEIDNVILFQCYIYYFTAGFHFFITAIIIHKLIIKSIALAHLRHNLHKNERFKGTSNKIGGAKNLRMRITQIPSRKNINREILFCCK